MHAFNKCDEHLRNICSNKYRGIKNKCIKSIKIHKVFEHMSFLHQSHTFCIALKIKEHDKSAS